MCGAATDTECQQGVVNICACTAGGCSEDQGNTLYQICHQHQSGEVTLRCWAYAADCVSGADTCGTL
jgi:hypothetical protein